MVKRLVLMPMYVFVYVCPGAALGRVPWVPVNPWIFKTFTKEPVKFEIKSDPWRVVNPWVEIPNVTPDYCLCTPNLGLPIYHPCILNVPHQTYTPNSELMSRLNPLKFFVTCDYSKCQNWVLYRPILLSLVNLGKKVPQEEKYFLHPKSSNKVNKVLIF